MSKSIFGLSLSFFWRFCLVLPLSTMICIVLTGTTMMQGSNPILFISIYASIFMSIAFTFYWLEKRRGMIVNIVKEEK